MEFYPYQEKPDDDLEGFVPFAIRDDLHGHVVLSYSREQEKYLISVDGALFPKALTLRELSSLADNINDIRDTPVEFYLYQENMDVYGNTTE